jgi:hypothetical protein
LLNLCTLLGTSAHLLPLCTSVLPHISTSGAEQVQNTYRVESWCKGAEV